MRLPYVKAGSGRSEKVAFILANLGYKVEDIRNGFQMISLMEADPKVKEQLKEHIQFA